MTILEGLIQAVPALGVLLMKADRAVERVPELRPEYEAAKAALNAAFDPGALAGLAGVLKSELANLAKGEIDPRDHPSDDV